MIDAILEREKKVYDIVSDLLLVIERELYTDRFRWH